MRIAIATLGRFWLLDLARELVRLGHEVKLYSCIPPKRCESFGLRREHQEFLLAPAALLLVCRTGIDAYLNNIIDAGLHRLIDQQVARKLTPCDVFIGLSGVFVAASRAAKERFGAKCIIERGNRHIRSQKRILDAVTPPGVKSEVSHRSLERELESYANADYISVPSNHVRASFLEEGFSSDRLLCNPYGVDLEMFRPSVVPNLPPTVVFSGTWSRRKGCDVLVEAWRIAKRDVPIRLFHVGRVADLSLPTESGFEHIGAVDQRMLPSVYSKGHVFAHASREEGLSLVQAQALGCGMSLVCTTRTGGADLREFLSDGDDLAVVPPESPGIFASALVSQISRAMVEKKRLRVRFSEGGRERISWKGYGDRYATNLERVVTGTSPLGVAG